MVSLRRAYAVLPYVSGRREDYGWLTAPADDRRACAGETRPDAPHGRGFRRVPGRWARSFRAETFSRGHGLPGRSPLLQFRVVFCSSPHRRPAGGIHARQTSAHPPLTAIMRSRRVFATSRFFPHHFLWPRATPTVRTDCAATVIAASSRCALQSRHHDVDRRVRSVGVIITMSRTCSDGGGDRAACARRVARHLISSRSQAFQLTRADARRAALRGKGLRCAMRCMPRCQARSHRTGASASRTASSRPRLHDSTVTPAPADELRSIVRNGTSRMRHLHQATCPHSESAFPTTKSAQCSLHQSTCLQETRKSRTK